MIWAFSCIDGGNFMNFWSNILIIGIAIMSRVLIFVGLVFSMLYVLSLGSGIGKRQILIVSIKIVLVLIILVALSSCFR